MALVCCAVLRRADGSTRLDSSGDWAAAAEEIDALYGYSAPAAVLHDTKLLESLRSAPLSSPMRRAGGTWSAPPIQSGKWAASTQPRSTSSHYWELKWVRALSLCSNVCAAYWTPLQCRSSSSDPTRTAGFDPIRSDPIACPPNCNITSTTAQQLSCLRTRCAAVRCEDTSRENLGSKAKEKQIPECWRGKSVYCRLPSRPVPSRVPTRVICEGIEWVRERPRIVCCTVNNSVNNGSFSGINWNASNPIANRWEHCSIRRRIKLVNRNSRKSTRAVALLELVLCRTKSAFRWKI